MDTWISVIRKEALASVIHGVADAGPAGNSGESVDSRGTMGWIATDRLTTEATAGSPHERIQNAETDGNQETRMPLR
jgi:hypothetical protein